MPLALTLAAALVSLLSGIPSLIAGPRSAWGQRVSVSMMVAASVAGSIGAWAALFGGSAAELGLPWPSMGNTFVGLDPLSAFFLVPIFLVGGLGSVYGLGYWPQEKHPGNGRSLQVFWGFLVAGLSLLVLARHGMAFLLGWEIMALSAFFLIASEDAKAESRKASLVYLMSTHIATLALFGFLLLWRASTGSFMFDPVAGSRIGIGAMNALFVLALLVFGLKAGMMPLHFWLPLAHANAPSQVSAILSGVVLKMGIYGLLRVLSLLPNPPVAWGGLILLSGALSGVLGVAFAIGQHDLKRLLAYHSVENIGIILMGLGLAMLGRSLERPDWVVLGLGACLLHVWNHSLFKSLLFFGAGSVLHATGTRAIDELGGLAKPMPWTSIFFITGAIAICGLPPLNGFVSEFMVYMGLFRSLGFEGARGSAAVIAAPALALIGALATACFVKVQGAVFLGTPRSETALRAREAPFSMLAPMGLLALLCAFIGLAPALVSTALDPVIALWAPESGFRRPDLGALVPLATIGLLSRVLLAAALVATLAIIASKRARRAAGQSLGQKPGTWDCGYAAPDSRMQYTASSFAASIVDMFHWVLRPRVHGPRVAGYFPLPTETHSEVDDAILDRSILPAMRSVEGWSVWLKRFQHGLIQQYMLYILIAVIVLLCTLIPFGEILALLSAR
jgi:hydrogenase-4 component B